MNLCETEKVCNYGISYKFSGVAVPQVLSCCPCSLCAKVLLDNILNPSFASDSASLVCE